MNLFSKIERNYLGPAEANENSFSYYERSARKDVSKIRDLLEKWFSNLPESEKHTKQRKDSQRALIPYFMNCFYSTFSKN